MLNKMKKQSFLLLAVLFLAAVFITACQEEASGVSGGPEVSGPDDPNSGNSFTPLTLGLTPGNDTTEINVNWYSAGATVDKVAKAKFIPLNAEGGLIEESLIEATGTVNAASAGNSAHKVTVTGLNPGTSYKYSVSNDGTLWSEKYDFKVPASGAFRFGIVTDPQILIETAKIDPRSRYPESDTTTVQGWQETMTKVIAANVSFIAACGDQVSPASNEANYTSFFSPPGLRSLPFAPAVGNHDGHIIFKHHFNLPNEQTFENVPVTQNMGQYFYLYNNVLFVVLNTGAVTPGSAAQAKPYVENYDQILDNATKAHKGKYDWLIVQHHKSTAGVAEHCADLDIQYYVEAGFESVMSKYNVDFVLAGHDHVYARSYPLSGRDGGLVSVPDTTKGGGNITNPGDPIYFTFTTASGMKYYTVSADPYFLYDGILGVRNNAVYPYLGLDTDAKATMAGSVQYMQGSLPVSNVKYVQPFIPSYTIVDVDGKTISFKTYVIETVTGRSPGASLDYSFDKNIPYDEVTVTKD
jgi:hypothetical protein